MSATSATRGCTCSRPRTTRSRRSSTGGAASGTRSSSSAATDCGTATSTPTTAQLLEAVASSPAGQVVILPNNKNIIPVAEQVDELTTKPVRVLKTRSVTEGFAALLAYDPDAGVDANAEAMQAAADRVVAGEV